MINRIQNLPNQFPKMINELREASRPIALYGAGEVASKVFGILGKNNLAIDAVWVDRVVNPTEIFHGITVQEIGGIQSINAFSIIVCIGNYKAAKDKLADHYRAEHIFLIDNIYSLPAIDYSFFLKHIDLFSSFYDSLSDVRSKDVMVAFLNARMTGNPEHLFDYYDPHQYFPLDIPGYPNFSERAIFVDCGAFIGDTLLDFVKHTNRKYRKIYAFEPDEKNYQTLLATIRNEKIKDVIPVHKGVYSSQNTARFISQDISSEISESGTTTIEVDAIDAMVDNDAVSFIKMDVEGSEFSALQGAQNTVRAHRPKLAVSVYHKPDDMITIPQYIQSLVPGYRFYLRAHKCMSIDVVLYALPQ